MSIVIQPSDWSPPPPPLRWSSRHASDREAFCVHMLLPGIAAAFHAATIGTSATTIASYRKRAAAAAHRDPSLVARARAAADRFTAEDGLRMAQLRGRAQLPHWARMAMFEYRKRGLSRSEIAVVFRCSRGTVANVLQGKGTGYGVLSGERRLTETQRRPPGRW
jgi:hypothetical protein